MFDAEDYEDKVKQIAKEAKMALDRESYRDFLEAVSGWVDEAIQQDETTASDGPRKRR
jgi:hypothetical protein